MGQAYRRYAVRARAPFATELPLTFLLLACVGSDGPSTVDDTSVVPADDTEQPVLDDTGDSAEPATPTALLVAEQAAITTSLYVTWSSPAPSSSWLEVTDADGVVHELRPAGDTLEAWILAPEGTSVTVAAATDLGDAVERSESAELTTGELPEAFELAPPEVSEGSLMGQRITLSAWDDDGGSVALQNVDGEVVWYRKADKQQTSMAARLRHAGDGIVLSDYGLSRTGEALEGMAANRLLVFGWGGQLLEELETPAGHHYFDVLPDDSVVWLQGQVHEVEGVDEPVVFDRAVSSATGEVFGTEDIAFDTTQCHNPTGYYRDACDAHHMNSVDCDPDAGRCVASLHASDRVLEFDSETGELLHDFSAWPVDVPEGESYAFVGAHDVQYVDGGAAILLFNTSWDGGSWAVRYEVDRKAEALTTSWTHGAGGCHYANAGGGVQELPDGHTLVLFGTPSGIVHEVDAAGEVVWRDSRSGWSDEEACMIDFDPSEQSLLGEVRSYTVDVLRGVLVL